MRGKSLISRIKDSITERTLAIAHRNDLCAHHFKTRAEDPYVSFADPLIVFAPQNDRLAGGVR